MDSRWLPSLDLLLGGGGGGIPIICAAISPWVEREGKPGKTKGHITYIICTLFLLLLHFQRLLEELYNNRRLAQFLVEKI